MPVVQSGASKYTVFDRISITRKQKYYKLYGDTRQSEVYGW